MPDDPYATRPHADVPDPHATTPPPVDAANTQLLCGLLGVQWNLIDRAACERALAGWQRDRSGLLAEILEKQGAIDAARRKMLEALLQKYLEQHGGDPVRSLESLSSLGTWAERLQPQLEPRLQATLAHVGQSPRILSGTVRGSDRSRFRILKPHARGGLGEVFVARDEELDRDVALKEIQARYGDHEESRVRFLKEAEITGKLEHPGIVPIYGLGTYDDGRPYYAMRFIHGDSLDDAIRRFHDPQRKWKDRGERELEFRKLLQRFIDVCNAIEYAHSKGILHRDLKPGNVMLGHYGETLVVDWGLAKRIGDKTPEQTGSFIPREPGGGVANGNSGDSDLTQYGQALGTPAYMSPEQAAGKLDELGPATDIYGLGATLYTLLTGKAPFRGPDLETLLDSVRRGLAQTDYPRRVEPLVPQALEAICVKALAPRPRERYASARDLIKDLESYLSDGYVSAYRESLAERTARWTRSHRSFVSSAVVLLTTAVVALVVGLVLVKQEQRQTDRQKEVAETKTQEAEANFKRAELRTAELLRETERATAASTRAQREQRISMSRLLANESKSLRTSDPVKSLLKAYQAANTTFSVSEPIIPAAETELREALASLGGKPLDDVRFDYASPNGRWLIDVEGSRIDVWDLNATDVAASRRSLVEHRDEIVASAVSANSQWLVTAGIDNVAAIWNLEGGKESRPISIPIAGMKDQVVTLKHTGLNERDRNIAISSNGKWLATATTLDRKTRLWNVESSRGKKSAQHVKELDCERTNILTFSRDDRLWATSHAGVSVFELALLDAEPRNIRSDDMSDDKFEEVRFSEDNRWCVLVNMYKSISIIDFRAPASAAPRILDGKNVSDVILSRDGKLLITAGQYSPRQVWSLEKPDSLPTTLTGPQSTIAMTECLGDMFAVSYSDRSIGIWDLRSPTAPPRILNGHFSNVTKLALSDKKKLVSVPYTGSARVWDLVGPSEVPRVFRDERNVVFASDGRRRICVRDDKIIVSGADDQDLDAYPLGKENPCRGLLISADGRRLVSRHPEKVLVHDLTASKIKWAVRSVALRFESYEPILSADGRWLADKVYSGRTTVVDLTYDEPEKAKRSFPVSTFGSHVLAFSGDSSMLFIGNGKAIDAYDLATTDGTKAIRTFAVPVEVFRLRASRDGRWLVAAGQRFDETTAYLWDLKSSEDKPRLLKGHEGQIVDLEFSPDSRYVVTGGSGFSSTVRVWDTHAADPSLGHKTFATEGIISSVNMSANSSHVFGRNDAGTAYIWPFVPEGSTSEPVLMRYRWMQDLEVTPDGKWLASQSNGSTQGLWHWRPEELLSFARRTLEREAAFAELKNLELVGTQGAVGTWSPDGSQIAFHTHGGEGVYVRELARGATRRLVARGKDARWSPGDGRWIAFVRENGGKEEVWVVDVAQGEERKLGLGGFPQWQADGRTIAFRSGLDSKRIVAVDVNDPAATPRTVFEHPQLGFFPALSPDGKFVAYQRGAELVVNRVVDGTTIASIPIVGWKGLLPLWSRDSRYLTYGSFCLEGVEEFWLLEVATKRRARLAYGKWTFGEISPDGRRMLIDKRGEQSELWLADLVIE